MTAIIAITAMITIETTTITLRERLPAEQETTETISTTAPDKSREESKSITKSSKSITLMWPRTRKMMMKPRG